MSFTTTPDHVMLSVFSRSNTPYIPQPLPAASYKDPSLSNQSNHLDRPSHGPQYFTGHKSYQPVAVTSINEEFLHFRELLLESIAGNDPPPPAPLSSQPAANIKSYKRKTPQPQETQDVISKRQKVNAASSVETHTFFSKNFEDQSGSQPLLSPAQSSQRYSCPPGTANNHAMTFSKNPQASPHSKGVAPMMSSAIQKKAVEEWAVDDSSELLNQFPILHGITQNYPQLQFEIQTLYQQASLPKSKSTGTENKETSKITQHRGIDASSQELSSKIVNRHDSYRVRTPYNSSIPSPQPSTSSTTTTGSRRPTSHSSMLATQQARLIVEMGKLQELNTAMSEEVEAARDAFPRMNWAASRIWDANQQLQSKNAALETRNTQLEGIHCADGLENISLQKQVDELAQEKKKLVEEVKQKNMVISTGQKFMAEASDKMKDFLLQSMEGSEFDWGEVVDSSEVLATTTNQDTESSMRDGSIYGSRQQHQQSPQSEPENISGGGPDIVSSLSEFFKNKDKENYRKLHPLAANFVLTLPKWTSVVINEVGLAH